MDTKTNPMRQTETTMAGDAHERLVRGDTMPHGDSLPRRIGHQLRSAYPAPETREDAFQSLLQKLATVLP